MRSQATTCLFESSRRAEATVFQTRPSLKESNVDLSFYELLYTNIVLVTTTILYKETWKMRVGPVIANNTPLVALWVLGRLDLLRELYDEVLIPQAVYEEFMATEHAERQTALENAPNAPASTSGLTWGRQRYWRWQKNAQRDWSSWMN
jgi:hypothetical protein